MFTITSFCFRRHGSIIGKFEAQNNTKKEINGKNNIDN